MLLTSEAVLSSLIYGQMPASSLSTGLVPGVFWSHPVLCLWPLGPDSDGLWAEELSETRKAANSFSPTNACKPVSAGSGSLWSRDDVHNMEEAGR